MLEGATAPHTLTQTAVMTAATWQWSYAWLFNVTCWSEWGPKNSMYSWSDCLLISNTNLHLLQEAAQLPDSKVDASFADELFAKVIGLPPSQQEEGYVAPHTQLQVYKLACGTAHQCWTLSTQAVCGSCTTIWMVIRALALCKYFVLCMLSNAP